MAFRQRFIMCNARTGGQRFIPPPPVSGPAILIVDAVGVGHDGVAYLVEFELASAIVSIGNPAAFGVDFSTNGFRQADYVESISGPLLTLAFVMEETDDIPFTFLVNSNANMVFYGGGYLPTPQSGNVVF